MQAILFEMNLEKSCKKAISQRSIFEQKLEEVVKKHKCYLCKSDNIENVKGKVRDRPGIQILKCKKCGLVFLNDFTHIDSNFYKNSRMRNRNSNCKEILKECSHDDLRRAKWFKTFTRDKSVLDFGCGAGGFLLKIKSAVSTCVGIEEEKKMREILSKKVKVFAGLDEVDEKFDFITLFHVLEHLVNPRNVLAQLSRLLDKNGQIIIETPNANDALLTLYDNEAFTQFTYWSCHLFLFNEKTLEILTKQAGLRTNFINQTQRYPLSNHLFWLAKGKPRGHKRWGLIDSDELTKAYEKQLASIGCCDTLMGSFKTKR